MRRKLSAGLLALALFGSWTTSNQAQNQPTSPYRVVIQQVDSTNFPEIELKFQVFLQDIQAQPWTPDQTIVIKEYVENTEGNAIDIESPARVCDEAPVLMSVAIDVSGSVADVMPQIKQGVTELFTEMEARASQNPAAKKDEGAIFAFSTSADLRFPEANAAASHTEELQDLSTMVKDVFGGGASPIWVNMDKELKKLLAHRPQERDYKRVLATLTDGQNNVDEGAITDLLTNAQRGGAQLFNLAYGSPNAQRLTQISDASGGAYLPGAESNIPRALVTLLQSVRTTYCVKYTSPFGDKVNEPATVVIETGGTRDISAYPLPFLIPEDTQQVKLFFPMTKWNYELIAAGGTPPGVKADLVLRDATPSNPQPYPNDGPMDRIRPYLPVYPIDEGRTTWVADEAADRYGFEIPIDPPVLTIPTDFVPLDVNIDDGEQLISAVQHYLVTAELVYVTDANGDTAQAGRQYPSATRLSVQDRTPPHVLVQLRPQDGRAILELKTGETGSYNVDTGIVVDGELSNEVARTPGFGNKRAKTEFKWRAPGGEAVEGELEDVLWSLMDPNAPDTPDSGTLPSAVTDVGIAVPEDQRLAVTILARDNFALVAENPDAEAEESWDIGQAYPLDGVPNHAQIDPNREEAQPGRLAAPFLPIKRRDELIRDRSLAGVAWWIEKNYNDPLQDGYADIESLPVLLFKHSDEEILRSLRDANRTPPPADTPLRHFVVRAQDGSGNVTLQRIALVVGDTAFDPKLMEWRRERAADY